MATNHTPKALREGALAGHKLIWAGISGFLLLLGLLMAGQRYIEYNRTIASTEDRLMAEARVLDENLGANLRFTNVLLTDIIRMQYGASRTSAVEMNAYLRQQAKLFPGIRTLVIADAHGHIIRTSRAKIIGFDASGRDYFKTALTVTDPARLIISRPFQSVLGTFVVNVTRKVMGKRGEFLGIVSASLDKDYFDTLLGSVLYAPDNRVSLVYEGGDVFISLPDTQADFAGKSLFKSGSLFLRHRESGKQVSIQHGRSSMLGDQRIAAFITCTPPGLQVEHRLVISVSRGLDAVLAPWRRDTATLVALYVLLCGISFAVSVVMILYRAEHKKAEVEHLKLRHLESLEILAGGMTHDFNNLIAAIIGFVQIAKSESQPGDLVHTTMTAAMKNCLHARELSQRLLTFATGGEHARVMRPITGIIEESVKEVLKDTPLRAELDLPENLQPVPIDAEQMRQVFFNLVENAKEAMPDGGVLSIEGENIHLTENDGLPLPAGDYIILTLQDTGIGIKTENIPRIFNPYFSTKDTYSQKGLGLGLAVCYSVIRRHGGLITIDSQVGKGTTVAIYLPTFE
ncbi:MAG TPA: ATP-binding protein [Nitrospirota bacterium]|nr:ATP-binding protein [Nitrospirota bacterium]